MSITDQPSQRSPISPERTLANRPDTMNGSPYTYETYSTIPLLPAAAPAVTRPVSTQHATRRRLGVPILVTLVLLVGVIAFGSLYGPRMFVGTQGQPAPTSLVVTGPFMQPPLNPSQINSIRHLVTYMQYKQLASLYVSRMTLDEELGQLIMVEYAEDYYSPQLDMMINQLHAGGVIMYEFQMKTFAQTRHDIAEMQKRAQLPLLISTDEEGGPYIHRLKNIYPPRPSASDIAATGNPNVAVKQANRVAHELLALGINENLAPDVDVNLVNGFDMVDRTFGNTAQEVIKFAGPYLQTLQGDGVVGCIKHYPGLGDAVPDAHATLPVVKRTREQIYSVELAPFKYFIQTQNKLEQPGMIMSTDVLMPAIDPVYPAELSHIFMTDILRKQFGFDGVVLTDALYMQGISQKWSMPEAAVLALNAGNDMLLGPTDADQMIQMLNGLKAALQNGTLSKARVDQAATRIIALKMEYHLMPAVAPQ